ncbi:hypothetical protein [Bacillus sp. P14.5]|uniref:hypothetical protein n=1 Tax=Bacillus sp. P14.5 TaxID=1983400 RepID=UPI000DEB46A9|nr:hypothetical protein [Bacillus sp. P14.5]
MRRRIKKITPRIGGIRANPKVKKEDNGLQRWNTGQREGDKRNITARKGGIRANQKEEKRR